jgi:hypothetical protein
MKLIWFLVIWPVIVVVINNFLASQQLKHMANVTCANFNKTGKVLMMLLASVRGLEKSLQNQGINVESSVDSRSGDEISRLIS